MLPTPILSRLWLRLQIRFLILTRSYVLVPIPIPILRYDFNPDFDYCFDSDYDYHSDYDCKSDSQFNYDSDSDFVFRIRLILRFPYRKLRPTLRK